jgi:hypothetical protein
MHERLQIDLTTGLWATADTPPERIVERTFVLYPPEAQEWARIRGIPEPPPLPNETLAHEAAAAKSGLDSDFYPLVITEPDFGAGYMIDLTLPEESQRIAVSARPGTTIDLDRVTLFVDGRVLASFKTPPYRAFWQLQEGEHVFWAEGVDRDGEKVRSDKVRIRVKNKE